MTRHLLAACCAGGLTVLAFSSVAAAQFPPPPTSQPAETQPSIERTDLPAAKTLFDRAVEAMGGREQIKKIKSSVMKANMQSAMGNMTMEMYSGGSNKFLIKQVMMGMGEMNTGCNGDVLWTSNPMSGYQLLPIEAAEDASGQATMYGMMLQLEKDTKEMKTVDDSMFSGRACYKVELTDVDGEKQHAYFDKMTNHLAGAEQSDVTPQGAMSSAISFSDWRKVGDLTIFHRVGVTQGPMQFDLVFTEVGFNNVPDSMFELPDEVKRLVAERDSSPTTQPGSPPTTQPGG